MDEEGDHPIEDVSVASSIPTDLSISEISDLKFELPNTNNKRTGFKTKKQQQKEKEKVARQLLEKKQLEHDLQLVKIELSQKEYLLDNVRSEYKMKVEELEEKLNDYKHQKKLIQAKSESQLTLQQDEAKRKTGRLQADLSVIRVRLRELEAHNESLMSKSCEVKQQLKEHVDVNEERYYELRSTADDLLSVKDLVAMRIFEALRPYRIELDEVKSRCERISVNLKESEDKATSWKQELDEERQQHAAAQVKLTRLTTQNQELESKASSKDYRINNYDRINKERDDFERSLNELRERNSLLEREFSTVDRDKKHFESECATSKSALSLLTQDKDYLTRQVCDLTNKLAYSEERLQRQTSELDEIKRAREELFEKYVSSRDQYKSQYEQQLQTELRHMSSTTQDEVEKLRATTRAMYEMESRTLRESRDIALTERDKAITEQAELQKRYQQLNELYRKEKADLDSELSQTRGEKKMLDYERSRAQLLQDETSKNLKDCQLENEKMLKKLEVANKEYYNLEMRFTQRSSDCESRIKEYEIKLEAYENIEKELDEVIMQAAEVDTEEQSEKAMLSYGYGASIPSSSQRRMKQSVHLARRCLALERQMVGDKRRVEELEATIDNLKQELSAANEKLVTADQPYSYVLNKTQELDKLNRELKKANHTLEVDLKSMKKKYQSASGDLQRMSHDLEASTRHADEITYMKQQLNNVMSKTTLTRQALLMNEMSDKERLLRAKRLIESGTQSNIRDAEAILKPVSELTPNPATSVLNKMMTLFEAVSYIDSILLAMASPNKQKPAADRVGTKPLTKARSNPIRTVGGADMMRGQDMGHPGMYHTTNQPAAINLNRKSSQRVKKSAIKRT